MIGAPQVSAVGSLSLRLRRFLSTVIHLRMSQIAYRVLRRIYRQKPKTFSGTTLKQRMSSWQRPLARTKQLIGSAELNMLGVTHKISTASDWREVTDDRLWLYHAHYFDDLCSEDAASRRAWHEELIDRWIAENRPGSVPGWDPYPSSRRIVNWLKWYLAGAELSQLAVDSLASQADLLSRRLELDLLGNHLLADLKALIFAGAILETAQSDGWLSDAQVKLAAQLPQQILGDGGHYELSPMYHAVVLEDLLDVVNLAQAASLPIENAICARIPKMLRWLRVVSHPDDQIALFNDAALDGCGSVRELEQYAGRLGFSQPERPEDGITLLRESGYARLAQGPFVVIADVGSVGSDHQPGHAHADSLTFEASLFGQRLVVNSGTSTYREGPERLWQRGTRAHNTITIDGEDSSEVWAAFRVGRRARVFDIELLETDDEYAVEASHNGYQKSFGVTHRRLWKLREDELTIVDQLTARSVHHLEWRLHLHPSIVANAVSSHTFQLSHRSFGRRIVLILDADLDVRLQKGAYSPEFGVSLDNTCVVAIGRTKDGIRRFSTHLKAEVT